MQPRIPLADVLCVNPTFHLTLAPAPCLHSPPSSPPNALSTSISSAATMVSRAHGSMMRSCATGDAGLLRLPCRLHRGSPFAQRRQGAERRRRADGAASWRVSAASGGVASSGGGQEEGGLDVGMSEVVARDMLIDALVEASDDDAKLEVSVSSHFAPPAGIQQQLTTTTNRRTS